jgi:uncharacterized protein YecA (UPF0149 family)
MQEFKRFDPEEGKLSNEEVERMFYEISDDRELFKAMNVDQTMMKLKDMELTKRVTFGRNGPCPCESGKKYKHCCGGVVK